MDQTLEYDIISDFHTSKNPRVQRETDEGILVSTGPNQAFARGIISCFGVS
jgi:hypothetical protein